MGVLVNCRLTANSLVAVANLAALLLSASLGASSTLTVEKMFEAHASNDHNPFYLGVDAKLGTELGEAGASQLAARMAAEKDEERLRLLASAIAYAGGKAAIEALQAKSVAKYPWARGMTFLVAPSARSEGMIQPLIRAVDQPRDEYSARTQAALSLALLKDKRAIPSLRRMAGERLGDSSAAKAAVTWIELPQATVKFEASSRDDDLLAAILPFYPPDSDPRLALLCDGIRTWRLGSDGWGVVPGCSQGASKVVLETFRSSDGLRAVAAVSVQGAVGYNYLLRKHGDRWAVVGIRHTWIA
ncbi:hypothetical protein [Usitatibacter palustris]|uniref:HEAT repeat domain-containing protein n=1 Tax=Usitatibacter palustris TaxID=2732487 RepID=A0A6M4H1X1_9PROT|nr:hypothetical protein [Usitatibacter palustris]QJR13335.1 hypothetical protein DSM104440_00118 [Usitatibacter palustris]